MESDAGDIDAAYLRLFREARPFRVWLTAIGALILVEAVTGALAVTVFHLSPNVARTPGAALWIGLFFMVMGLLTFVVPVVACWRVDPALRRIVLFGTLSPRELIVFSACTSIFAFALQEVAVVVFHRIPQPIVRTAPGSGRVVGFVLFVTFVLVFAPIVEELGFQGWLQSRLDRLVRPWPSVVLTTLVFAAIHLGRAPLVGLPLGTFAVLRLRTKSLGACMTAHCFYNVLVLLSALASRYG